MSILAVVPENTSSIGFLAMALVPLGLVLRLWIRGILNAMSSRRMQISGTRVQLSTHPLLASALERSTYSALLRPSISLSLKLDDAV